MIMVEKNIYNQTWSHKSFGMDEEDKKYRTSRVVWNGLSWIIVNWLGLKTGTPFLSLFFGSWKVRKVT